MIVGVHTPEFEFARNPKLVANAGLSLYSFTFGNNWENKFVHR